MLGLIKSIGTKAISSLPVFSSSRLKLTLPQDDNLEQKLQEISSQILKSEPAEQFKIYQQLQSPQSADFNRSLRKIYECEDCSTQSLNGIIKFYTFLLTNCKNELVICKLVSEPLVIELTKIVLHIDQQIQDNKYIGPVAEDALIQKKQILMQEQTIGQVQIKVTQGEQFMQGQPNLIQTQEKNQHTSISASSQQKPKINQTKKTNTIGRLHYNKYIDWDEVNAYKVALIRAYINCINPETINYMIVDNELPIFVNCVNGYKHYLTEGVEGTCISNCILMILTKINHNDQVCRILFDEGHHAKYEHSTQKNNNTIDSSRQQYQQKSENLIGSIKSNNTMLVQKLSKSISNQQPIKLHQFIQQVIEKIGDHLRLVIKSLRQSQTECLKRYPSNQVTAQKGTYRRISQEQMRTKLQLMLSPHSNKIGLFEEFIESNVMFCVDLIASISNYHYTAKMKQAVGKVVEELIIAQIINYVQQEKANTFSKTSQSFISEKQQQQDQINGFRLSTVFSLTLLKMIKQALNLSIVCNSEQVLVGFLNRHSQKILSNIININDICYRKQTSQDSSLQEQEHKNNAQKKTILPHENTLSIQTALSISQVNELNQENSPVMLSTATPISPDLIKYSLSYLCTYSLILVKQTISPHSKLSSRKMLQHSKPQLSSLKQTILSQIFLIFDQLTTYTELKQKLCLKAIRNLLLTVFYLTIKSDKCSVDQGSVKNSKRNQNRSCRNQSDKTNNNNAGSNQKNNKKGSINGLSISFNYSILKLHKAYSLLFKQLLKENSNWQFIVHHYETLMREVPNTILSPQQSQKHCHYHNNNNYPLEDQIRDGILVYEAVRNYRYMIIGETNLEQRLIRLENIYHKHFLSPGWGYTPGETFSFNSKQEYKMVCNGLLHNNTLMKLPIEILNDNQCLLIVHKIRQNKFRVIANIRYKKIGSFVPEGKGVIRMKLIGIQELILQFGSNKTQQVFREYLSENRNKTRQKQLKFINYYMNMYLRDSEQMIEKIYEQDIVGNDDGIGQIANSEAAEKDYSQQNNGIYDDQGRGDGVRKGKDKKEEEEEKEDKKEEEGKNKKEEEEEEEEKEAFSVSIDSEDATHNNNNTDMSAN